MFTPIRSGETRQRVVEVFADQTEVIAETIEVATQATELLQDLLRTFLDA